MEQKHLMGEVMRMLSAREAAAARRGDISAANAYNSAWFMVMYATMGAEDCLRQFDYYKEEE